MIGSLYVENFPQMEAIYTLMISKPTYWTTLFHVPPSSTSDDPPAGGVFLSPTKIEANTFQRPGEINGATSFLAKLSLPFRWP